MKEPTFDANGYPTPETIRTIIDWDHQNIHELFDFITDAWHTTGVVRVNYPEWEFVTGGWSGNEMLISALKENYVVSSLSWMKSERGGLHVYTIPENQRK